MIVNSRNECFQIEYVFMSDDQHTEKINEIGKKKNVRWIQWIQWIH